MANLEGLLSKISVGGSNIRNKVEVVSGQPEISENYIWTDLKRTAVAVYDWLAYFGSGHDAYKKAYNAKDFNEFVSNMNTANKCGSVSHHLLTYVFDPEGHDYWQKAIETFNRRNSKNEMEGDCDDWSGLFLKAMKDAGIEAYFLTCWGTDRQGEESGHAICYVPGMNETICTFGRTLHSADNVTEVAGFWFPVLRGYTLYTLNDNDEYDRVAGQSFPDAKLPAALASKTEFAHVLKGDLKLGQVSTKGNMSIDKLVAKASFGYENGKRVQDKGFDKDLGMDIIESYSKTEESLYKKIMNRITKIRLNI